MLLGCRGSLEPAMLSAKREMVEEACSQLSCPGPLQPPHVPASNMNKDVLHQQITPTVSGHKRPGTAITTPDCQRPSQRTCRELFFSPDCSQAAPAISAQQPTNARPHEQASRFPVAEASAQVAYRQTTPTQLAQPPVAAMPVQSVADPWSLLLANSSWVLRQRLSSSNLLSPAMGTGRQLLELEVQLQALLGIRKDEEGSDNICWVDHGFLHYAQGVMYFHRMYGDDECAQVP